ncbi:MULTISPECIES: class II aldolase/adducin family protein [unclassified Bradyrhizobium]|uniref:class II aldolase/adducin family protein n=1 Tax=unclassified Bradyrhizobium TaxID=2631580 RepID=UPI001FF16E82|nr:MULTISPECIES: class II aldolase/adducin family protein [unclassified Bradyrhizobium]MCJ9700118.1 class II aldolase/adducin family protein [Bradyrhizobium sp. SHOUNA76]MCJ9733446.1 class II aldolase/adducin family protein [Bradyrhizobium sp. PRIMUS42]
MQHQSALLNELRRMSARVGRNILLVQGAGGNSSIKHDDILWVKASGTWLADAEQKDIFVPVPLGAARTALAQDDVRVPLAANAGTTLRPSIETSLHALMPHPVVLHVHSVNTIAWAVRTDAREEFARRLDGLAWRWLDYHHPGLPLAKAVQNALAQDRIDVLILGNHGLVVGAETCAAAEALVDEVETRLALEPRSTIGPDEEARRSLCAGTPYRLTRDPQCHSIAIDPSSRAIATSGSLYPDHVVFLGPGLPVLERGEDLRALTSRVRADGLPHPVALLIPGLGCVIRKDASDGAEAMLSCLALVICRLPLTAQVRYLTQNNEAALVNWDAERYRQQLTATRGAD